VSNVSAVPALLDALVAALTAALPAVTVYDGPGNTDDAPADYLLVGVPDPDSDSSEASVESTVEWASLGAKSRYETSTVWCAAISWTGDTPNPANPSVMKTVRDRVFATFAAVEQTLVADPSLGDVARFGGIGSTHRTMQNITADGTEAWVVFGLTFRARLSG